MDSVTNAQLMNAIKLLTRKVETLQEEVASLKGQAPVKRKTVAGSVQLPESWAYPSVTSSIVNAVLANPGLKDAAAQLGMKESDLKKCLETSGIFHMYGEKWSVAIKRAIAGEPAEDTFEYPEKWFENKEKFREYVEEHGVSKAAEKLEKPRFVVGRFIQLHC